MDKLHKMFIKFSIIFLLMGTMLGMTMSMGLLEPAVFRFAHVHMNLLGFVINLIFGVAYHILPRFNGKQIRFPKFVAIHLYAGNAGLIGMVVFYTMQYITDMAMVSILFYLSAFAYLVTIVLFAVNIMEILTDAKQVITKDNINKDTLALDLLKKWPAASGIFESNNAGIINRSTSGLFRKGWTIEQLCSKAGIDPDIFVFTLKAGIDTIEKNQDKTGDTTLADTVGKKAHPIKRGDLCSKDVLVGDLLKTYPETRPVFEKHYGESCFSCPGQAYESIEETTAMHNMSIDVILGEVNEIIKTVNRA